jgi:hypothetical protein
MVTIYSQDRAEPICSYRRSMPKLGGEPYKTNPAAISSIAIDEIYNVLLKVMDAHGDAAYPDSAGCPQIEAGAR